ncbi:MAG: hypothetical protein IKR18_10510 [Bacteroidaceae bacterium]|nr:hypothetical protein [Bacteroidaceae bacterium]
MKTNELNNGIKEVYAKPALEVEEMEMQWNYCQDTDDTSGGYNPSTGGGDDVLGDDPSDC